MARIAFVQNICMEYLGIMHLASVVKSRGDQVQVFVGGNVKRLLKDLKDYKPDIVGFSSTTGIHNKDLVVARTIKSSIKTMTLFGGPHPTFFPEIIEDNAVDVVCIGEGEGALSDLADAVNSNTSIDHIQNCWVKKEGHIIKNRLRPLIEDLDSLPFPDRSIYYDKYPFMNLSRKIFIGGRGCPYKCTYCFNDSFRKLYDGNGKHVRLRSVDNLILEIDRICKKYNTKTVFMLDDTFVINKPWLFEFLEKYKKAVKLPFICLVRADLLTEEIVERLRGANCASVCFGVESGDENLRKLVLNKNITDLQIIEAAALLKKYKIRFRTYNMVGLPGEGVEDALKTIDLNVRIKTDYPWCSILQPYPKTAIRELALKKGMLKDEGEPRNMDGYFFKKSILNSSAIKNISNIQKLFYWSVKIPFLRPLIKKLIKLPPNPVFEIIFLTGYAFSYYKSERLRLTEVLRIGYSNIASFISSR